MERWLFVDVLPWSIGMRRPVDLDPARAG